MVAAIKTTNGSAHSLSPSPPDSLAMAAPPHPAVPPAAKQRKKPGPKPKAKAPRTLLVKLKIKPEILAQIKTFPPETTTVLTTPNGSSPSGTSPQPSVEASETILAPPVQKRKGIPGPKPGAKRVRQPGAPPQKPGRKKAKLDPSLPPGALLNGATHGVKLGPKANTGAINDKLRALDRTGKKSKRWKKAGFTLKSFTGVQWTVPAWATPKSHQIIHPDNTAMSTSENTSATATTSPDDKMQTDIPNPIIPVLALPQGITA